MTNNYTFLDTATDDGFYVLEITEGEFEGVQYTYGKVEFGEEEAEDGSCIMHYEYKIVKDDFGSVPQNKDAFDKLTGDIVLDILTKQLDNNEVIYSGGVDDNGPISDNNTRESL